MTSPTAPLARSRSLVGGVLLVLAGWAVAGCGSDAADQVTEMTAVIVKTAAGVQGQVALADAGIEVSGPLSCTAEPDGDAFAVSCTGTSLEGREITLSGTATSVPGGQSVAGTFVATAGGQQVLSTDCLGQC